MIGAGKYDCAVLLVVQLAAATLPTPRYPPRAARHRTPPLHRRTRGSARRRMRGRTRWRTRRTHSAADARTRSVRTRGPSVEHAATAPAEPNLRREHTACRPARSPLASRLKQMRLAAPASPVIHRRARSPLVAMATAAPRPHDSRRRGNSPTSALRDSERQAAIASVRSRPAAGTGAIGKRTPGPGPHVVGATANHQQHHDGF